MRLPRRLALIWILGAAGCGGEDTREVALEVVPLPAGACPGAGPVRQVVIKVLGDFAPTEETAIAGPVSGGAGALSRSIPNGTRVITVEGQGDRGELMAMGRSAELATSAPPALRRLRLLYAAPRAACPTRPLARPRAQHTATLLAGGGVLVAGGVTLINNEERLAADSELYDAAEAAFVRGPDLYRRDPLIGHSATRLADGRVLVFGGETAAYQLVAADGKSAEAPGFLSGADRRAFHGAVALPDGRALLVGGCSTLDELHVCRPGSALDSTARFDPRSGLVEPGPRLLGARVEPEVMLRGDGMVVVAGGSDAAGAPLERMEVLDPTSDVAASALIGAAGGRLAALSTGGLVGIGGPRAAARRTAALLMLGQDAHPLGMLGEARAGAALAALEDGSVLVSGGLPAAAAARADAVELELYRPESGGFEPLRATLLHRSDHSATLLGDGSVLLVGGRDPSPGAGSRIRGDAELLVVTLASPYMNLAPVFFGSAPAEVAVSRPPARLLTGPARLRLAAGDRALLAGPSYADVTVTLKLGTSGRAAVLLAHGDEAHFARLELEAGQPARLARADVTAPGGVAISEVCSGRTVPALAAPVDVVVRRQGGRVSASVAGSELLSCSATLGRGAVGVAALSGDVEVVTLGADR